MKKVYYIKNEGGVRPWVIYSGIVAENNCIEYAVYKDDSILYKYAVYKFARAKLLDLRGRGDIGWLFRF